MKFNIKAFLWHFLCSITIIGLIALIVLKLWFPAPWAKELGGYDLFIKIIIIDLFVGPLCVGLTFKPTKRMILNIIDVTVISLCQLAFVGYGAWVLSESRPVFIVFNKDRYEIIVVNEVQADSFGKQTPFNQLSLTGPIYTAVDLEATEPDAKKREDARLLTMMSLVDFSAYPKYYVGINKKKEEIRKVAKGYNDIPEGPFKTLIDSKIDQLKLLKEEFLWLPVMHKFGSIVAILDKTTMLPLDYVIIDSYEVLKGK